jgi:undecaprenyl-diphosphatase
MLLPLWYLLVLALVQSVAEFLPISSSGHLILLSHLSGMPDQGVMLDMASHVGTLMAVLVMYRARFVAMGRDVLQVRKTRMTPNVGLFLLLCLGTVPIMLAGFLLKDTIASFRSPVLIACTSLVYAPLLWLADRRTASRRLADLTGKDALLIGCAQALALVPGTSRSGATMTMARFLGFSRVEAADFSFLLSVPAVMAAAVLTGYKAVKSGENLFSADMLIVTLATFVLAVVVIKFILKWLRTHTFTPFVLYRLALAGVLLAVFA